MGKTGKVSSIKKEYNRNNGSLEASLALNGYSRFPGTGARFVVYKEPNGAYRTGLDPDALYLKKMKETQPENYKIEVDRIKKTRKRLEEATGLDLGPRSDYYTKMFDDNLTIRAQVIKLKEGDNVYDLDDPFQEITYEWLKVHPMIASSYQAYERGEYPANTQFYVNDDNVEEEIKYKKKILVNEAIKLLDSLSVEKMKKVARLMGLPVTDNSKERTVYNLLDTQIKDIEVRSGDFKGSNPVELFTKFANLNDKLLASKDLVEQAIRHSVYRVTKGGRITEGSTEIAKSKQDLVDMLMDDKYQDDLFALQEKLKMKKAVLS